MPFLMHKNKSALISELDTEEVNHTEKKMSDESEREVPLVYETYLSLFATLEWWEMANLIWLSKEHPEISLDEKQIASLCQLRGRLSNLRGELREVDSRIEMWLSMTLNPQAELWFFFPFVFAF